MVPTMHSKQSRKAALGRYLECSKSKIGNGDPLSPKRIFCFLYSKSDQHTTKPARLCVQLCCMFIVRAVTFFKREARLSLLFLAGAL